MSGKRTILIVDDEAILLLSMKQELRLKFGAAYHYETALNAAQGLAVMDRLVKQGIDVPLVISDWLMPGMRGDAFLRRIREKSPQTKLVLLSGHADRAQMEKLAAEIGLLSFMSKPYVSSTLYDVVSRAMKTD